MTMTTLQEMKMETYLEELLLIETLHKLLILNFSNNNNIR